MLKEWCIPNCQKVEKGNWLYAKGSRPLLELSFDESAHDEDLYDHSYSEMILQTFGVHWCPFSRLAQMPSSFGSSSSRIVGSFISSLIPSYITSSRPHNSHGHGHGHICDPYQQYNRLIPTVVSGSHQRQAAPNPLPQVGPTPPSLHDQAPYYLMPPPPPPPPLASFSRSHHQEVESNTGDHFYSWERDNRVASVPPFMWRQFPY